jgi:hypothetical protein
MLSPKSSESFGSNRSQPLTRTGIVNRTIIGQVETVPFLPPFQMEATASQKPTLALWVPIIDRQTISVSSVLYLFPDC